MAGSTAIATWFVEDRAGEATFFPQVGAQSDAPAAKAAYWRCTACFFASSLAVNPDARHLFYTNTALPRVDGVDMAALLACWGVEVITLPITWRLPAGSVASWGNQFYVFDIIDHAAAQPPADRLVVLDSDCLWRKPVAGIEQAIDRHGALTYLLAEDEHPKGEPINGLTRAGLARFVEEAGGPARAEAPYFGGEILAVHARMLPRIAARSRELWPDVERQGPNAPREEAHLLSAVYALEGVDPATANPFIRRMWTTFHHHNLVPEDEGLTIWHLPAEKRTGFADLFRAMTRRPGLHPARDGASMGLAPAAMARTMGYPRRPLAKLVRDGMLKLLERITR